MRFEIILIKMKKKIEIKREPESTMEYTNAMNEDCTLSDCEAVSRAKVKVCRWGCKKKGGKNHSCAIKRYTFRDQYYSCPCNDYTTRFVNPARHMMKCGIREPKLSVTSGRRSLNTTRVVLKKIKR